jgi:hypothetical protein
MKRGIAMECVRVRQVYKASCAFPDTPTGRAEMVLLLAQFADAGRTNAAKSCEGVVIENDSINRALHFTCTFDGCGSWDYRDRMGSDAKTVYMDMVVTPALVSLARVLAVVPCPDNVIAELSKLAIDKK